MRSLNRLRYLDRDDALFLGGAAVAIGAAAWVHVVLALAAIGLLVAMIGLVRAR